MPVNATISVVRAIEFTYHFLYQQHPGVDDSKFITISTLHKSPDGFQTGRSMVISTLFILITAHYGIQRSVILLSVLHISEGGGQ